MKNENTNPGTFTSNRKLDAPIFSAADADTRAIFSFVAEVQLAASRAVS